MESHARRWDLFCTVVDNFGDIAVSWRLARQLAREHGLAIRLWVDDLATFRRLCPAIDPAAGAQRIEGVDVRHWSEPFPETLAAPVVIETFGCRLPDRYVEAMARARPAPAWINLEHLSAEKWVPGCHRLPSPHPRLPLTTHFFFPGFAVGTGGLLREADLFERRDGFQASASMQCEFWRGLGLPDAAPGQITVSLFGYPGAPIGDLLDGWSSGPVPIRAIVPQAPGLLPLAGLPAGAPKPLRRGRLELWPIPFLDQDRYDELLWACAVNFVRGEDSFVRAQWAARPFVWQAYPQADGAHLHKLEAFLALFCDGLEPAAAAAAAGLWREWNEGRKPAGAWPEFWRRRAVLAAHGQAWVQRIARPGDLAKNLVAYVAELL